MLSIIIPIKDDHQSLSVILEEIQSRSKEFTNTLEVRESERVYELDDSTILKSNEGGGTDSKSRVKNKKKIEQDTRFNSQNYRIHNTKIKKRFSANKMRTNPVSVIVVDDGSKYPLPELKFENINTYVIRKQYSQGHQESIVEGMRYCIQNKLDDHIVVMDGDGEDLVRDISKLLGKLGENPLAWVVCAQRGKRDTSFIFNLGLFAFRILFRIFTGRSIQTGNFMVIRKEVTKALMNFPNLSTNLAASVMRYAPEIALVKLDRGSRIQGKSKMKIAQLALHGYSAIAVFADIALSRMILLSTFSLIGSFTLVFLILILKILGWLQAIPGWTSVVLLQLISLFSVPFYLVIFTTLVFLNLKWKNVRNDER